MAGLEHQCTEPCSQHCTWKHCCPGQQSPCPPPPGASEACGAPSTSGMGGRTSLCTLSWSFPGDQALRGDMIDGPYWSQHTITGQHPQAGRPASDTQARGPSHMGWCLGPYLRDRVSTREEPPHPLIAWQCEFPLPLSAPAGRNPVPCPLRLSLMPLLRPVGTRKCLGAPSQPETASGDAAA